jgi:uncharacterized membrane protein
MGQTRQLVLGVFTVGLAISSLSTAFLNAAFMYVVYLANAKVHQQRPHNLQLKNGVNGMAPWKF